MTEACGALRTLQPHWHAMDTPMTTPRDRVAELMRRAGPNDINQLIADISPTRRTTRLLERVAADEFAAGWRADPFTMARHLEPDQVLDWPSSRLLAAKFREAVEGTNRFQVWNAPTQTVGKSTWLRYGMLYAFDKHPEGSMLYLCHSDRLARQGAIFVRDRAKKYRDELAFELSPTLAQQGHWMTTRGGQLLATYIGGGAGFPASLGVVIDDPLKNWQEAHSPARRDTVWDEILAVARMRLAEQAFMVMAHTRLHLDDPSGRMRALEEETGQRVDHVVLPMIAREHDPIGRAVGEPLERFSEAEAMNRRNFVGDYLASAMEDQAPVADEGGELKREWWRHTDNPPRKASQAFTSWDMKMTDRGTGDYVVGLAMCRVGADFFILDQLRGQFTLLETKIAIGLMAIRWPWVHRHIIENTGNGPDVIAQLRAGDPEFVMNDALRTSIPMSDDEAQHVQELIRYGIGGLIAETPKFSKVVRARTYAAHLQNGNVWLPTDAPWTAAFVDEAATFPPKPGGHDDRVDAWSQGMKHLDRAPGKVYVGTDEAPRGNAAGAAKAIPSQSTTSAPRASSGRGNARVWRG